MPLSMKIQPINARDATEPPTRPPVVRSRLKRLFRISVADKPVVTGTDESLFPPAASDLQFVEPSSACLAKMVQNFIEESNDKPPPPSGRHCCNCFNGNTSDGSDTEPDSVDSSDSLKGLVTCASVIERSLLADTAKIVEKSGKRKDEVRNSVAEGLVALGYDASLCISKWDKSPSFPAGEYEYVDVIAAKTGERLIVDVDFRSEFEIARPTKAYKSILQMLPSVFVGKADRLARIVTAVSEAAKASLKKKGLHFPPWRKAEYVQSKWLSPHTRLRSGSSQATSLVMESFGTANPCELPPLLDTSNEKGEEDDFCNSMDDQPIFAMSSESSGEEDVNIRKKAP